MPNQNSDIRIKAENVFELSYYKALEGLDGLKFVRQRITADKNKAKRLMLLPAAKAED